MNRAPKRASLRALPPAGEANLLQFFARVASIHALDELSDGEALVLAEEFARLFPKLGGGKGSPRERTRARLEDLHRRLRDLVRSSETGDPFPLENLLDLDEPRGIVDPTTRELELALPEDDGSPLAALRRVVRLGRRVPLRRCARDGCGVVFVPKRLTSKYHSPQCLYLARLEDEGRMEQKREAVRRARARAKGLTADGRRKR